MKNNPLLSICAVAIVICTLSISFGIGKKQGFQQSVGQVITPKHNPMIIAHRGGARLGIENSLSCIEQGIAVGSDMIEIDVHLTADNQVIVHHDYELERTTNGTGKVEDYTLEQLREFRLLNKDKTPSDEVIPTLEDVLLLCKDRCPILLEIKHRKGHNDGIEALCVQLVKKHKMEKQVVFQSFTPESMADVHALAPEMVTELLLGEDFEVELPTDSAYKAYLDENLPFITSLNVHYSMATEEYINRVHKCGREIKIWTLDKPELAPQGVQAIITNCPDQYIE